MFVRRHTFPIAKKSRMPFNFQYWNHVGFYVKSTTLLFYLSLTFAAVCTSGTYSLDSLYFYYINADLVFLQLRRATGLHGFLAVDPPGCSSLLLTHNIFIINKRFATVSSQTLLPSLLPVISHTLSMRPRSEPVTLLLKSPLSNRRDIDIDVILNQVNRLVTSSESSELSSCSSRIRIILILIDEGNLRYCWSTSTASHGISHGIPTATPTTSTAADFPPVGQATIIARLPGPHTRLRNNNVFIYKKAVATAIDQAMIPPLRPALPHTVCVLLATTLVEWLPSSHANLVATGPDDTPWQKLRAPPNNISVSSLQNLRTFVFLIISCLGYPLIPLHSRLLQRCCDLILMMMLEPINLLCLLPPFDKASFRFDFGSVLLSDLLATSMWHGWVSCSDFTKKTLWPLPRKPYSHSHPWGGMFGRSVTICS